MQVHSNEVFTTFNMCVLKLSRMQYQCFVAGCDKQYLYMSSLKKHLVISHPKEYAAKVKTRQSKC